MANEIKANEQVNNKKNTSKKASKHVAMSSHITFSHRTPSQLHASTYINNNK